MKSESKQVLKRPKITQKAQAKDKIYNEIEGNSKSAQQMQRKYSLPKVFNLPRNVNYFSHFFKHAYITGSDINWVLKLRTDNPDMSEKIAKIPTQPFSVGDKNITSQEKLHTFQDISLNGPINNHEHLLKKRKGPTANLGQVEFETSLRNKKDNKYYELERNFTTVAKKDRKEFPQLMPRVNEERELRRLIEHEKNNFKNLNLEQKRLFLQKQTKLTHTAFDGFQNYPNYTYKIKTAQNIQSSRHLLTSDAFMSTTNWEMSLR